MQTTLQKNTQQKIVLRCKPQNFDQWAAALSFYSVSLCSPERPLEKELAQAALDQTDLFVIIDDVQSSDESLVNSLRTYLETDQRATTRMRIAFVADRRRELPSPLFRILANYDIYDIIVPPKDNLLDFNPYVEVAQVLSRSKSYSEIVPYLAGEIVNPKLVGLTSAEALRERTRAQVRIAVAQIDQRRGGSTHTSILFARVLVLLGYKVALFIDDRTWKNMRRCYPRARCNVETA